MRTKVFVVAAILPTLSWARIAVIDSESEVIEVPRSAIKTYVQTRSLEQNLKPIKQAKPSALPDEELAAIPERYLPPELQLKQRQIKKRMADESKQRQSQRVRAATPIEIGKEGQVVTIRSRDKKGTQRIKLEEAIWVPPTAAVDAAILAPQRKLPEVELIQALSIETSGTVKKEVKAGEIREITELFAGGKTTDKDRVPLLAAYGAYAEKDYASAVTLGASVMSDSKQSAETRTLARYLIAHSLFQAGFFGAAQPLLVDLVSTKWRRSAVGMIALALEKTRDDSVASQVLSKVSLSQIPEDQQTLFSFHLGRILLNQGARAPALAAFQKVQSNHPRYPESMYLSGILLSAELSSRNSAEDWDKEDSAVGLSRLSFEQALTAAEASNLKDLRSLIQLALARLAYQVGQFHQANFYYDQIPNSSPYVREALYESGWSLFRLGEFNRSLGRLHALGSSYFEDRDLPELWILRSLSYLKLCRFEEARTAANTFQARLESIRPELEAARGRVKTQSLAAPSKVQELDSPKWVLEVFASDPIYLRDLATENLYRMESAKLSGILNNPRIADQELKSSAYESLMALYEKKRQALGRALVPYLVSRLDGLLTEYRSQRERLDFLRFEIYNQATQFPAALERREAQKLIARREFLPGVFLKGHEILWRYTGELWEDELKGYDYFIPTECRKDGA
jgi:tetratricopeptide (TPR) repeat protein